MVNVRNAIQSMTFITFLRHVDEVLPAQRWHNLLNDHSNTCKSLLNLPLFNTSDAVRMSDDMLNSRLISRMKFPDQVQSFHYPSGDIVWLGWTINM